MTKTDTFPRQHARTQRFSLGEPRNLVVSPDGRRVAFLRSQHGDDPVTCLWVLDVPSGEERLVANPVDLLGGAADLDNLPEAERARRERARETAGGITGFATDPDVRVAVFTIAGRLFRTGLVRAPAFEMPVDGPVFDARPDPTARRIAYVAGTTLRVVDLSGQEELCVKDDDPEVTWGSAEFIAMEEMNRARGYWWAPDGDRLAVARVDNSPVGRWFVANPAEPADEPQELAYPAAGTANADVQLFIVDLDGERVEVGWDREAYPYLVNVCWTAGAPLTLVVSSRSQRTMHTLTADPETGTTTVIDTQNDDAWVELTPGTPAWLGDQLVSVATIDNARRLVVDGKPVSPDVVEVRSLVHVSDAGVVFLGNDIDEPAELHAWRWTESIGLEPLTSEPATHAVWVGGETIVVRTAPLDGPPHTSVVDGPALESFAEAPLVELNIRFHRSGERQLATAVLLPAGHEPGSGQLPVLLDPYGGPHAQRVMKSRNGHLTSQWFADQGFAVIVADGRGTPGRGASWERAVHLDLGGPVLDDQIDALHAVAELYPDDIDLTRVAIRGWSFGGYLAALAVLRRPDEIHAAVAGAPVTEWRLYDTHYTERYLGDPTKDAAPYDATSLLPLAPTLSRPLLLIHGLADDNVVAAHTLRFSRALLEAGRHHEVLPLCGVTHITPQEQVAENLLLHQLTFLRRSLGLE